MKNEVLDKKKNKADEIAALLKELDDEDIAMLMFGAKLLQAKKEVTKNKKIKAN